MWGRGVSHQFRVHRVRPDHLTADPHQGADTQRRQLADPGKHTGKVLSTSEATCAALKRKKHTIIIISQNKQSAHVCLFQILQQMLCKISTVCDLLCITAENIQ